MATRLTIHVNGLKHGVTADADPPPTGFTPGTCT
jgi:hypothetical protein